MVNYLLNGKYSLSKPKNIVVNLHQIKEDHFARYHSIITG
jgi:hypothetical protein